MLLGCVVCIWACGSHVGACDVRVDARAVPVPVFRVWSCVVCLRPCTVFVDLITKIISILSLTLTI